MDNFWEVSTEEIYNENGDVVLVQNTDDCVDFFEEV